MDRETIVSELARAEWYITSGQDKIAQQRQLVAELEMGGLDATEAHKELTRLEAAQRLHSEHRDALLRRLRTLNG
jgi:hypothetical protein